uniref:TNFR-Cys domain-containing protein n=1 Tax=Callorhinchus milii TaxID=7868 RepID=A0A4W3JBM7_CALMI
MQLCRSILLVFHKWTAIWILSVLALTTHSNSQLLNSSCDQHYDKMKSCCNECQPGFYLSSPCTESKPVDCKPCGEGEYLEHSNSQAECFKQIECDEIKGFEVLQKGDTVKATQCVCTAGSHCSQDCEYCLKDNPCHPGYGVTEKGEVMLLE